MQTNLHLTKKFHKEPVSRNSFVFFISIIACLVVIGLLIMLQHIIIPQTVNQKREKIAAMGLHVQENQLVNGQGQQVILHGVDRSGTEYECAKNNNKIFDGPNDDASIQAMKSWKINAVRVPLNEDCWLGVNGTNPSGTVYQQAIKNYVALLARNNMYIILDLHWNAPGSNEATGQQNMADRDHALSFWTSIAQTFKSKQNVLLDLYNEPRYISWSCWKNGTDCSTSFQVASMQDMINSIRATGANNILLLSGLNFANDLSGWLANEPSDPVNNIAASWHMYGKNTCDTTGCWDRTVAPVIAKVPVIATEFGESFDQSICTTSTSTTFMSWMDAHHSGYLAWTWDAWSTNCNDLSLITDYSGTPKNPNGVNYKNHLAQF